MRVIFAGTPEFARVALQRLHAAGFSIALVLTQPDRPAGRGLKLSASPVKQFALAQGLPLAQPRSLRTDGKYPADAAAAQAAMAAARADVMVVAAYGLILPQWVLDAMGAAGTAAQTGGLGLGCLNIHASLLPRWRGAAPIHRAIEAGDAQTGITIMQMDAGLDTGDLLLAAKLPIRHAAQTDAAGRVLAAHTTATLHDELAALGGQLLLQALQQAARGSLSATPQPAAGVSYAHKIEKHEATIDWHAPGALIDRRIRAFDPFPGASAQLHTPGGSQTLKLFCSEFNSGCRPIGADIGQIVSITPARLEIAVGDGTLSVRELQRAGGKRLPPDQFARGLALREGQRLDTAPAPPPAPAA